MGGELSERAIPSTALCLVPFAVGLVGGGAVFVDVGLPWLGVVVLAALAVGWMGRRRPLGVTGLAGALGVVVGGVGTSWTATISPPPDHLVHCVARAVTAVEGTLVAVERRATGAMLLVAATHARSVTEAGPVTGLLAVTVAHPARTWLPGSRVRVVARLRRPHAFGNPGEGDVAGLLARRGVRVTAFLWDERGLELLAVPAEGVRGRLGALRAKASGRIAALTTEPVRGYLDAVLLGDGGAVDRATRRILARTGLAHVTSVSGFHVAVVAASVMVTIRRLLRRSSWVLLHLDATKLVVVGGLPAVLLYAGLAGGSVPAARALLMYGVVVAAALVDRPPDGWRSLAAAAVLLALGAFDVGRDVSFQLSFAAVAGLLVGAEVNARTRVITGARGEWTRRVLREPLRLSLAASVATAPLTAWHFQQVSLIGPAANLLALPLLGPLCLMPGLAALPLLDLAPSVADVLLGLAARAAAAGLTIAMVFDRVPGAAVATPMPSVLELASIYAALALPFLPWRPRVDDGRRRISGRRLSALVLACVVCADVGYWTWERFGSPLLRVTFLAVGQGDATVLELPGGPVLVVDGGGFPGEFDPGERLIAPFLRSRKIMRVDVLVLSHPQLDHYGGLAYLAEHFRPRELWWNGQTTTAAGFRRLEEALARAGTERRVLGRGRPARAFGAIRVALLHPPLPALGDPNEASLVLRVVHHATSILLTGDVERGAEAALVASGQHLEAAVLKVPHHGSDTSSTRAFLAAVRPRVAVVSAGADNRFGFPASAVLDRLGAAGAEVWTTATDGAVRVVSDGTRVVVTTPRGSRAPREIAW